MAYLTAQDEARASAEEHYSELLHVAATHTQKEVRFEALGMIALLNHADAEETLLARFGAEAEPSNAEWARVLLYRLSTAKVVRASGQMSEQKISAYRASVRRQGAEALFR